MSFKKIFAGLVLIGLMIISMSCEKKENETRNVVYEHFQAIMFYDSFPYVFIINAKNFKFDPATGQFKAQNGGRISCVYAKDNPQRMGEGFSFLNNLEFRVVWEFITIIDVSKDGSSSRAFTYQRSDGKYKYIIVETRLPDLSNHANDK